MFFPYFQYFEHVEEIEWAIEVAKETKKPVAGNMCIGPEGDMHGVSAGDCAVRMAKAGKGLVRGSVNTEVIDCEMELNNNMLFQKQN